MSIWRIPDEETTDLYPELVIHDGQTLAICRTCNTDWPCDEFVRLDLPEDT